MQDEREARENNPERRCKTREAGETRACVRSLVPFSLLAEGLQLDVFIVASAQREKLVVSTGLADGAVLDEVAAEKNRYQHTHT